MGNTALSSVLDRDDVLDEAPVKAKRGVNTHLGAITEELKSIAKAELNPIESDIVELDPKDIVFSDKINHRFQDWLSEDNKSFLQLVRSIELAGQKMPIMVRPREDGRYELIYGSRRRQAAELLGIKVRALVANGVSDNEAHELAILENTNHSGLSPIEEARAVLAYKERNAPISDKDVGVVFTKSRQWVGFQMSFANLDPLFIGCCSNPWIITERGTREFRSQWNNDTKQRSQWLKQLKKMQREGQRLPYRQLMDQLNGVQRQEQLTVLRDKQGRVVAEVGASSSKHGRRIRRICLYEEFDRAQLQRFIKELAEDFDHTPEDV